MKVVRWCSAKQCVKRTNGILLLIFLHAVCLTMFGKSEQSNSTPIPGSVQAAESEGATFPHSDVPQSVQPSFKAGASDGTAERRCVEFPDPQITMIGLTKSGHIVTASRRSGEIIVGGMIPGLKAGEPGKVWWAPLHDPFGPKSTLVVRSALIDHPEVTSRFSGTDYAWPMAADMTVNRDNAFFPSGFSLPSTGRWLLTVTSGNDWGCFIVTVH